MYKNATRLFFIVNEISAGSIDLSCAFALNKFSGEDDVAVIALLVDDIEEKTHGLS